MKTNVLLLGCIAVAALAIFTLPVWAQGGPDDNQMPPPPPGPAGGGPPPFAPSPEDMDANNDGNVTLDEYTAAWDKVIKERFKKMDANADGQLSKEELAKRPGPGLRGEGRGPGGEGRGPDGGWRGPDRGVGEEGPGAGPRPPMDRPERPGFGPPRPSIEEMDTNKDGSVSEDEFSAAWRKLNEVQFRRMDENGDGILSKDELAKCKGPGSRGPGGPGGPGGSR